MELPRYETQIISIPVVTQARRRSLLNRLGPWPLKRARSEADTDTGPLATPTDEFTEKINLKTVLTRLDEECAAIDKVLIRDSVDKTLLGAESLQEMGPTNKPVIAEAACNVIRVFMVLAVMLICISTPLMTSMFAGQDRGKIYLAEKAPSKIALAAMLSLPAVSVGFLFGVAVVSLALHERGWNPFRTTSEAIGAVVFGLVVGATLDVWVLAWLMPLVEHH
jgi:hypothetical protein